MIRITLLTLLIAYLSVYAWKDWFRGACWLVLLMAIFQHPDMPKSIAGIPGLNHWNFLFLNVIFAWLSNRKKEKITWEMPKHISILLFLYSFIIIVSVIRYLSDMSGVIEFINVYGGETPRVLPVINEYLVNCFKWALPGMIIFDGCRTKKQYDFALIMLLLMYFLLGLQVIKAMKLGSLGISGEGLQRKALKVLTKNVGFHRVNLSMMLSGAFWLIFCTKEYLNKKQFWLYILPGCTVTFLAMALTGGRTGYATWAILGAVFCLFKWRRYLLLVPFLLIGILAFAPSMVERFTQGILEEESSSLDNSDISFESNELDAESITSGRVIAWPLVWKSIKMAPYFGYGRQAMMNIGLTLKIMRDYQGESFPHPHNLYLQWLQDNGIIGALPVFVFYILVIKYSWSLFKDKRNNIYIVTGGGCLALVAAFLIAGFGSQNFYPREGAVGMWVMMGLMLRVRIEREKYNSNKKTELIINPQ
ncbi:O-antigen ligase [Psychromonas sp. SR45-3]|uniref:O-antigen ligase family protein n=1 Tax=Psychromonas sp. SR45-3 TaxID=2760930 RepID=UPI0015F97DAF|nr:O-antigen ligase family protein [Psychromonas sp. SR45-3]MBB1274381.1 O-antigen ligase family protein [Psychromonas sp. SR45-3]